MDTFIRRTKFTLRRWLRRFSKAGVTLPRRAAGASGTKANPGWCACCRHETQFEETGVWLRDQYLCVRCQAIPRFRAVNVVLDRYFEGWERLNIHESSPSNDFIRQYASTYSVSYFFEGVPPGTRHNGTRCENLEHLTFADNTFDLFITQD